MCLCGVPHRFFETILWNFFKKYRWIYEYEEKQFTFILFNYNYIWLNSIEFKFSLTDQSSANKRINKTNKTAIFFVSGNLDDNDSSVVYFATALLLLLRRNSPRKARCDLSLQSTQYFFRVRWILRSFLRNLWGATYVLCFEPLDNTKRSPGVKEYKK